LLKKSVEILEFIKDPHEVIDYSKELLDVRKILQTALINKENIDKIVQLIDNTIKKKIDENIGFITKYISELENEVNSEGFEIKFYKLIYCLAKLQTLKKTDKMNIYERLTLKTKNSLTNLTQKFNLSKLDNNAIIVYLTSLDYLKMNKDIPHIISHKLTLESFDLDNFNILYKTIIRKYKDYISSGELETNFLTIFSEQLKSFDARKIKFFNDTLLFIFKNTCSSVYFYNNISYLNRNKSKLVKDFFTNSFELIKKNVNDKNILFHFLNLSMELISNPSSLMEKYFFNNINVFDIDKPLLVQFINNLLFRLNFIWQFDHEIFLLKKRNKFTIEVYHEYINDILTTFLKQIINKFESSSLNSNSVDPEYLEFVIKSIIYINTIDNLYEDYQVSNEMKACLASFFNKLVKNSEIVFQTLSANSSQLFSNFSSILVPLLYYTNSHNSSKTFNNDDFSEHILDKYLKHLISKPVPTEELIEIYKNILELYISYPESELRTISNTNKQIMNSLFNHIQKNLLKLDNKGKLDPTCLKRKNYSNEIKFIEFLINYSFLFKKLHFKYENLHLIEKFIEKSTVLRNLKSNYLVKFNDSMITFNSLAQIVSNLQTITFFNTKSTVSSNYVNQNSIKGLIITIINNIHKHKLLENDTKNQIFNFSPLSSVSSLIFNDLDVEDLIKLLKILGNKNLENYHPTFVLKLTQNYCNEKKLKQIYMKNEDNLFNLAFNWPFFLKNEQILNLILSIDELKLLRLEMINMSNVISYHHTIHSKLLEFVLFNVKRLRNEEQIDVIDNYINNCAYLGYRMSVKSYQELLSIYTSLKKEQTENDFEIISDLLMISVISNHNIDDFSSSSKEIFKDLCYKLEIFLNNKISINYKDKTINYYPSIGSEDRYFHKAISNDFFYMSYNLPKQNQSSLNDAKEEISPEDKESKLKSYMRQGREGNSMDEDYDSFFNKKKDLMYGNQSLLQDEFKIKPVLKYWLLTNYFLFRYEEDTILSEEFKRIFFKIVDSYKKNRQFEKLYLNLLSFTIENKIYLETNHFDFNTNIYLDYFLFLKGKTNIIIFVPQNQLCLNYDTNEYEMNGLYKLISVTVAKSNPNYKIIHLFEDALVNLSNEDLKLKLYQKINVLD